MNKSGVRFAMPRGLLMGDSPVRGLSVVEGEKERRKQRRAYVPLVSSGKVGGGGWFFRRRERAPEGGVAGRF